MPDADALDAANVRPEETVAMVGAFTPFIKALKTTVRQLGDRQTPRRAAG